MIPVLWLAQSDGRGYYNCTTAVNDMLDRYECLHIPAQDFHQKLYRDFRRATADATDGFEGAVLIVHGGRQPGSIDRVNMILDDLKWAVVIVLGDEECTFPVEQLQHDRMKIWIQEPMPGRHDFCDRFIIDGWTPHTHKYVTPGISYVKDLDFVFAGQMTHTRRWACRNALQTIDWGGVIVESKGYCQGVSIEEYYRLLCRAHIVPCPSGPFAPDAARPWEALECGAVPILDDLSPTRKEPGFWKIVLGPDHPLPTITNWDTLPARIGEIKENWVNINAECQEWWAEYKDAFNHWLREDIEELCKTPQS